MRILIKGGVWKNTEDEILKAAVMKYGKNQWARVASLLSRKSAKQCKARWYEWLDPSIKKTEWNRDEEEKLLHLAKLMPNQWRTIAPIVGRTAGQCMEHYEKLLDQAQEGVEEATTEDPRRLRAGEIDPAPETKPARPDPIDMDDDEKEMLSEARARLANTKGKKAKRKARERQMEESRRLSVLQKRRELKAAGMESSNGGAGGKKRKYIDYAREIPFQKVPPAGFYEVQEETASGRQQAKALNPAAAGLEVSKMEGRHQKEEEEKEKAKDKKRLKSLFKANAPLAIAKLQEVNDPTTLRKHSILSLPAPQVTDGELEDIVRMGQTSMAPPDSLPTKALLGDYSSLYTAGGASNTPMRTPVEEDMLLQEARNQRVLRDMTPLVESDELPELYEGTGFEGVNPRNAKLMTPNVVLSSTPAAAGGGGQGVASTPGSVMSGMTNTTGGKMLQIRDHFGLNEPYAGDDHTSMADDESMVSFQSTQPSIATTSASNFQYAGQQRKQLASKLMSLPEPEFIYEVKVPETSGSSVTLEDVEEAEYDENGEVVVDMSVEDQADVVERNRVQGLKDAALAMERRSTVLKRGLPRPAWLGSETPSYYGLSQPLGYVHSSDGDHGSALTAASVLVGQEMIAMLDQDEIAHPHSDSITNGSTRLNRNTTAAVYSDEAMQDAKDVLARELMNFDPPSLEEFTTQWEEVFKNRMYLPSQKKYGMPANKADMLMGLESNFDSLKYKVDKNMKKATKLENKVALRSQGYVNRANKTRDALVQAYKLNREAVDQLAAFKSLFAAEQRALSRRANQLLTEITTAEENEAFMQQKYGELVQHSYAAQQDLTEGMQVEQ